MRASAGYMFVKGACVVMTNSESDAIVRQVLQGDIDRYGELVGEYQKSVWRIVMFSGGSLQATEDLVQKAFVQAFQNLSQFRQGADFGVWVRAIARNLALNELRRRSREDHRMGAYTEHVETFADEDGIRHATHLTEALGRCRERLADAARQALRLRYDEARDFGEVATLLGRSLAATRQLLQRARLALRECIDKELARL